LTIEISNVITVIAITAFAGCTSFIGALISHKVRFSESKILILTAFGAGLFMSAVIFQMVVEAEKDIGLVLTMISFVAGAVIFTIADYIAEKKAEGGYITRNRIRFDPGVSSNRDIDSCSSRTYNSFSCYHRNPKHT
jgi:zinc transporter, ZIP family